MEKHSCKVVGCNNNADFEVMLYDVYDHGEVFCERDHTCPFLCRKHMIENEKGAEGELRPRGVVVYPYTNTESAQGFTIYRTL